MTLRLLMEIKVCIAHPINSETRDMIQRVILEKYADAVAGLGEEDSSESEQQ